jgi:hypothetical protein
MGAMGLGLGLAFGRKGGGNPPPPASVASPVVGTDLTAVWNLQYGGTGTNAAFSNGTWSTVTPGTGGSTTNLPTYLINQGVVWNNYGELWIDVGTTTKTISNYDFSNAPPISFNGTGAGNVTFTNCRFAGTPTGIYGSVYFPADLNQNVSYSDLTPMTAIFNNCTFSVATFFMGSGYISFNNCRFTLQTQGLGDAGFSGAGVASITYNQCFITGGGIAPAASAHVEYTAIQRGPVTGNLLTVSNCFIDVSREGQTTTASWGSSWTGGWYPGDTVTNLTNNIMIGSVAVNANVTNPNVFNCWLAYAGPRTTAVTMTNNCMEIGSLGYCKTQSVDPYRPTDGGGNRSYANVAVSSGGAGWN